MSLISQALSPSFFTDLCSSNLPADTLVDTLSELEAGAQLEAGKANPATLERLATYYTVYLLSLILDHDLNEARFLLQRIPEPISSEPQFANATALLRALYTRNYPAVYSTLSNPTWSADVIPLRDRVQEDFKQSTFQLLSRAYKSISPASAAFYLGLETADQDTIKLLVAQGWKYDEASGLLCPSVKFDNEVLRSAQKDERIGRLTSLVTHLTEV